MESNFESSLKILIEIIQLENNKHSKSNPSYMYLLNKLSMLSDKNVGDIKDDIMYFIIDSYNGNKIIENKVVTFLSLYTAKNK